VGHAVTIIGAVSSTKDRLSFEQDTLDALLDGFTASGWKKTAAATIPAGDDPKVASATPAKPRAHKAAAAAKVGVAEAQSSKAVAPAAAPAPSAAIEAPAPAPRQLAPGMPAVCATYAAAACNDPSLPPEIDRDQFCAGVYRRVNGFANDADAGKTCKALLKDMTPQRRTR
jgi:hypothetical protein